MHTLTLHQPLQRLHAGFASFPNLLRLVAASLLCLVAVNSAIANPEAADANVGASVVVNINSADAATLAERLVGIGTSRAQAIVDYRNANGKFQDPYELAAVKGVGESIVAKNESRIRLYD